MGASLTLEEILTTLLSTEKTEDRQMWSPFA